MTRILHIVAHLKKNGTETFIMNMFRNIDKEKYQFDFLVFSNKKEGYYNEIIELGGKVYFLPSRNRGFFKYHRALNEFFKHHKKDYTIVHYHVSSFTSVAPVLYAKIHNIQKRIIHCHNSNCTGFHNKLLHRINKYRIKSIGTNFLACSEKAKIWGYLNTPIYSQTQIITNGIETDKFSFNDKIRQNYRNSMHVDDKFVIGHVGTFNKIKNHSFLLNVFKKVLERNQNCVLICVGEGILLNESKELAHKLGIHDNVLFIGKRDDVSCIMQAFDILMLPSLHEGLGIVAIEAQAASLPVIASDNIPEEAKVSPDVKFIPLSHSQNIWADEILSYQNHNRTASYIEDINKLYSIQRTLTQIESIYSV